MRRCCLGTGSIPAAHYRELGRYRGKPIGGFAIGIERFIMVMTGVSDIRETTAFDRWQQRRAYGMIIFFGKEQNAQPSEMEEICA